MAAYTGLLTGAGGAAGLETLFARMRAEEQLRNQGRQVDLNEFEAQQLAKYRNEDLGLRTRQWNEGAGQRDANLAGTQATTASTQAGTEQTGLENEALKQRNSILAGFTSPGAPGQVNVPPNNPQGRMALRMADIPPNDIHGSVDISNTGDEKIWRAYAKQVHGDENAPLSYQEMMAALRGKPAAVIAQGNLNIRREESDLRKQKMQLEIEAKKRDLEDEVPVIYRQLALAEFQNRIQNDIQTSQSWSQWMNGESVADPAAQITAIQTEILNKYRNMAAGGNPDGTGGRGTQRNPTEKPPTNNTTPPPPTTGRGGFAEELRRRQQNRGR